ncbi:hypothetical protein GSI_08603 [Ganoderma sinense ZZ0214-1]|uniref:Uncharacterized protein n=1 Tax=Ganoderma sinense ZZ0214-1 TaxID=1077348 RepID=A0A2G8S468_9APHY|nr:hypothetical protein GSI_08603 [Ganoderma sinense ZZ0214-1]
MSTSTPSPAPTHNEKSHPPDCKSSENLNEKLENPLARIHHKQLIVDAAEFVLTHGLEEYTETMQTGALVAQDPPTLERLSLIIEDDRSVLRREFTHKGDQPWTCTTSS